MMRIVGLLHLSQFMILPAKEQIQKISVLEITYNERSII